MKYKLTRVLLLLAALAALLAVTAFAAGAEEPYVAESDFYCAALGDANGDRVVTTADARAVLRSAVYIEFLPDRVAQRCDLDGRSGLSVEDARKVLRIAIGLESRPAHLSAETVTTQPATCYEQGISAHICAWCGEYYDFGVIPERPHTAAGWDVEREPTCSNTGERRQYCVYCGVVIARETIPQTSHIYGPMRFKGDAPDCTRAQEVYKVCVNCGYAEEWVRLGTDHSYTWVTVSAPTCIELGKQEEVCRVCGIKSGSTRNVFSLGGHIPSGWTVIKYPSRVEEGLQRIVCTRCGEILEEQVLPKIE